MWCWMFTLVNIKVAHKGAILVSWGAIAGKGGGFLKFWCFQNLETYPKYSWVTDEIQKKFQTNLSVFLKLTLDIIELKIKSKKKRF